jgi:translation initiation factor IF-1
MIARIVHQHTPDNQLLRPEFSQYKINMSDIPGKMKKHIMNLDSYPVLK